MRNNQLAGKKILLGVTGSIAIYKALELIRLFIKAGAEVKVLMSEDAKRFITPLTFEAISQNKVLHADTESWSEGLSHIHTGKWADLFVIAPASVNTINKLSHGIADNLLTQTAIAFTKTIVLAPSANTNMMLNPITQESLLKLETLGYEIIAPQSKLLACNDEGVGALADVEQIFYHCARLLLKEAFWSEREVVITGGGTMEKIDDVRCLTNFSSGKQASALALAFYLRGANVTLISSGETPQINAINTLHVKSTAELHAALLSQMQYVTKNEKTPYLLMAAAVSDYVPIKTHEGKLKKEELGESYTLELKRNVDVLTSLPKRGFKMVGFKAEIDESKALANASVMLEKKGLDAVCLNVLKEQNSFGSSKNEVHFITASHVQKFALAGKFEIAEQIVKQCSHL
ncbi:MULTISPECIES: bifunctional phosphopantothenoylcysteine decarboxylase/phosphopantothenate--cysteine ligase CoaBC [unclassified Sulfurospirillum]|uniref:bifunctional phosphopantothenoylcysteine decarboxylase/phosphopantothenate--cysteine ligase CoaBC n=1 Tax=unclassified Sulfurospirillum TaxID=2618290 RepID=UPI000508D142|nr:MULTISPECIES: bifunctional phosphopantothenoylcysteine decarboxylase/phosphopantothenate--cysteine ligase CoaBC [unclassified Sulfurospirillum]KFL35336.1 phosphopantothenoylcysteine decarboxylase [Sulfurospirillum sp. SCADC]